MAAAQGVPMSSHDAGGKAFSDAWHRVATVRVALRTSVRAHRQTFRGRAWFMLRDTLSSDWFRVSAEAWAFLGQLTLERTVDEAWQQALQADPEHALTQEEVVQLLGQLNLSNLLLFDQHSTEGTLFERYRKRRQGELKSLLMGFMSIRVPLLDPDRLLQRLLPLIRVLFSAPVAVAYGLLLALGGKTLLDHADELAGQGAGLLAPGNVGLLYLGVLLSKVIHEFGHAAACKRFGGEVHKMGVMLLLGAPLPYVDASASWGFRRPAERMLVGAAGVVAELAVAAVAALVWAHTAPGTLNALAFDVIFVASVSTLVFNLNPLLRFDGYHILTDLVGMPNLFQRSREQLRHLGERWLLRLPETQPVAQTRAEGALLALYGVASLAYWLVLMVTMIFFVADQYLDLGIALAWLLGFMVLGVPLFKFVRYLAADPRLRHARARAIAITLALGAATAVLLGAVPLPDRVRATGVLEAQSFRQLHSESGGFVVEMRATPGTQVQAGQVLMRLDNPELLASLRHAQEQRAQLVAQQVRAAALAVADLAALERQIQAADEEIAELERQYRALEVVAPIAGLWSAPELETGSGRWVARGAALGTIVGGGGWRVVAVLPQVSTHLFDDEVRQLEIKLIGQEEITLVAQRVEVLPFDQGQLPSAALGFAGGGDIAVSPTDPHGLTTAEPIFRIHAALPNVLPEAPALLHGRLGQVRITLGARPLARQWERGLRQFLQRRYRV
jgi:putative peptide zinc metalloprotease protein